MSEKKISEVSWSFMIRPDNKIKVTIMQRQDGPFATDMEKGKGQYYTSAEKWNGSTWDFIKGSTGHTTYNTFEKAFNAALALEKELK